MTNRWLGAAGGIGCVVILRLILYTYYPTLESDFDLLYRAAEHLLRGENPYPIARQWFASILPSWPRDWLLALQDEHAHIRSPILRPFGFLLLLAALRWKTPEGRLLLIMGILPQNTQPHDLVPLALIPRNLTQMGIYFVGTWLAVMAVGQGWEDQGITIAMRNDAAWPMILGTVYLPMLYLVLRRTSRVPDETLP